MEPMHWATYRKRLLGFMGPMATNSMLLWLAKHNNTAFVIGGRKFSIIFLHDHGSEPCPYCGCPGEDYDGHCCEDYVSEEVSMPITDERMLANGVCNSPGRGAREARRT